VSLSIKVLPLIALAAAVGATGALAQKNEPQPVKPPGGPHSAMMADHCKQMMAMHEQMAADMKAMDAKLEQMVAIMNAATGSAKTEAMAAVINEMASQRKETMAKMSSMQSRMMAHTGEHMAQSGGPHMGHAMAQCPMMKGATR
jgi:hypothetical protein